MSFILVLDQNTQLWLTSVSILIPTMGVLCFLFIPKFWKIYQKKINDTKQSTTSNLSALNTVNSHMLKEESLSSRSEGYNQDY